MDLLKGFSENKEVSSSRNREVFHVLSKDDIVSHLKSTVIEALEKDCLSCQELAKIARHSREED